MLCAALLSAFGAPAVDEGVQPQAAADSIAIGLLLPQLQGEAASLRQGALLAIEHSNRLPGTKVRLIARGEAGQWGTEGNDAAALVLDDEVDGMITPSSGIAAHQVLQVAGRTQVPVVSLCPDSSITGAGVPWAIQIVPGNRLEAATLFSEIEKKAGKPLCWGAAVPQGRAGREPAKDLKDAASSAGVDLLDPIEVPSDLSDAQALARVLVGRPDVVLLWTDPSTAGSLASALRQAGFRGWLAGPGRLNSASFLSSAGTAAHGMLIASLEPVDAPRVNNGFVEDYQARFSNRPDFAALMAYDAALLLVETLRKAEPGQAFRSFRPPTPLTGASGVLRFTADGSRIVSLALAVCRDGEFAPFKPVASTARAAQLRAARNAPKVAQEL